MKRRVSGVEFAEVWGRICQWPEKDRGDLVHLLNGITATSPTEPKERKSRKPRGSEYVVHPETESAVKKMRLRRGDGSLANETPDEPKP